MDWSKSNLWKRARFGNLAVCLLDKSRFLWSGAPTERPLLKKRYADIRQNLQWSGIDFIDTFISGTNIKTGHISQPPSSSRCLIVPSFKRIQHGFNPVARVPLNRLSPTFSSSWAVILTILCSKFIQGESVDSSADGLKTNAGACASLTVLQASTDPFGSRLSTEAIEHKKEPT